VERSASALINKFGETVTITRNDSPGSYVNGVFVEGSTTSISATISMQPLNGRELLNIPEAQRNREFLKGYSSVQLYTVELSPSQKADVITYRGNQYEVQSVEEWRSSNNTIEPYWKIRVAKVNP